MLQPLVGIIMGSSSDFAIMNEAAQILEKLEIPFEINIVSAHRTPQKMMEYAANAHLGWDSILSILQMPNGVPVATVALNAAQNAGIIAAQIIGTSDKSVLQKVLDFKDELKTKVMRSEVELTEKEFKFRIRS